MAAALRALVAAASAEGGGGGLADVNLGLTIWTIALFALFAAVLAKFGWGPLLRAIEEREKSIRDALEGAQKANDESQVLLAQHKEVRDHEHDRTYRLGFDRLHIATGAVPFRPALPGIDSPFVSGVQTLADAEHLLQKAKEQIEREKRTALQEIRAQVADLAIEAASKIVTSSLTPEAQRKLVEDFIAKLPTTAS